MIITQPLQTVPKEINHEVRKKEIQIWTLFFFIKKRKKRRCNTSSLAGEAHEVISRLDIGKLSSDFDVENVIRELDKLYLRNSNFSVYES